MDRDKAYKLLCRYNTKQGLIKHAFAVEGVMRHFAKIYKEDEDLWGLVGLLHDLDYEKYPEDHLEHQREILEKEGYPEEIIRATESHGWGICTNVKPETMLEKTLYTIDELTGLIVACAFVQPSKKLSDVSLKSVLNKWKNKGFAGGVDRNVIENRAAMMGIERDDLINETLIGMQEVSDILDL